MSLSQRMDATRAFFRDMSLDMLVAFGGGMHSQGLFEPVLVLSQFRTIGPSAAALDRHGNLTLLIGPSWDVSRARRLAPTGATIIGADDLVSSLRQLIHASNLSADRIGYCGIEHLTVRIAKGAQEALGPGAVRVEEEMRKVCQIRSAEDLKNAERATEIAELGYSRLLSTAHAGLAEYQLAADLYCFMKGLGAEDNFLLINASQHGRGVAPPSGRILEEGDLILTEITPCVGWQFSQICRTVSIGKPSQRVTETYAILQTALKVGMDSALPGTTVAATAEAMNRVFKDAGYGSYCRPPYMRVRGHGLGSYSDLPGDIEPSNQTPFAENMFFVMHPNQYLPETGYLMCGEPVRITPAGAFPLTHRPSTLDWVKP